jgi:serine/threonine-protein kinase
MDASFEQIQTIFHGALGVPATRRRAYLESACEGNAELLRYVESLLQHNAEPTEAFVDVVKPLASDLLATTIEAEGELRPGAMLGPYGVEKKLGHGGMGAVYVASDTRLGRDVAVKVIRRDLARTSEARARFLREARSAAALSHPNIAMLHDVGETDETLWLVMELVKGVSLRSRLTGPLAEETWRQFAVELASALEHAHQRRIIHRDIKPENILITEDEHVKVIDFGLARAVSEQQQLEVARVTAPNTFVGTIAYSAPELLTGASASPRSDVYGLGVVLYEMACGEQPFAQTSRHGLVAAILSGAFPKLTARNASFPARLAAIVQLCMSCNAAERYRDGGELGAALRKASAGVPFWPESRFEAQSPMLAVMDFRNIGRAQDLDWLGTGIAETLSADLAKLKSVRVASRSRVVGALQRLGRAFDDPATASELGSSLGARWVVTGGYQVSGERIRVTAALVDTATGDSLAAEKIDGRWDDLFEVQDRVVAALLEVLTIGFGSTDERKILPPETRNLVAYEHYVKGRREMYRMDPESLTAAILHLERAVALDPDYAFAYSGLGTAYALRFISSGNPEDVARSSRYLERAIELDPELGEPYPWLSNTRFRRNDLKGGLEAARKAVDLQPDLPEGHYFYGGLPYMVPEMEPGRLRTSIWHIAESIRVEPRHHAGWVILGAAAIFLGRYAEALPVLTEAIRLEGTADLKYRFVGGRTLRAMAHGRLGAWDVARAEHVQAVETLRNSTHIYATAFHTLSLCGLGDIELRYGSPGAALLYYRRARGLATESRQIVGSVRLLIRVNASLASAYAATGETARAIELLDEARTALAGPATLPSAATIECSLAQLQLCIATAEVRVGQLEQAEASLDRARQLGWLDAHWLRNDPELRPLARSGAFELFVNELESAPAVHIALPEIPAVRSNAD